MTARYGLLGEHLPHSFSPRVHQLLGSYDYALIELPPAELGSFLRARRFRGLNVTIPYKKAVIPYCDTLSPAARRIGSVNTLVVRADGRLHGDNTDYGGLCRLAGYAGVRFAEEKTLVLGSGGAAATARAVAADLGAAEIVVVSRSGPVDYQNVYALHGDAAVVINATPCGMYPHNDGLPLDVRRLPRCRGVLDMVYNPLRTRLVLAAGRQGAAARGGLLMLTEQARLASALFQGVDIPWQRSVEMLKTLAMELENIVLVGMPGAGKSTVGAALARQLARPFVDLDETIARETGRSPAQWISEQGEAAFRAVEQAAVEEAAKRQGLVIATGGGVVLRQENIAALRQNSRIFFLDRPLDALAVQGRPLSRDGAALARLYAQRLPLYQACAARTIRNEAAPPDVAQAVFQAFQEVLDEDLSDQRPES